MAAIGMTMVGIFSSGPACTPPSGDNKAKARPKRKQRAYSTPVAALDKMIRKRGEPTAFWTYSTPMVPKNSESTDSTRRIRRPESLKRNTGRSIRPPRGGLSLTRLEGCPVSPARVDQRAASLRLRRRKGL